MYNAISLRLYFHAAIPDVRGEQEGGIIWSIGNDKSSMEHINCVRLC